MMKELDIDFKVVIFNRIKEIKDKVENFIR